MDVPPSPNHKPDFPVDDPPIPEEDPEEDPQEDPKEEPEEDPQEDPKEEQEEEEEEPDKAQQAQQIDWEEDEDEEPEEAPALSAAQETARVENIRLRRELEEAHMSNTLLRIGLKRTQRDLHEMSDWAYGFYEGMLRIGAVGDRMSEAIDVLAVYGKSQPPRP
ncbi:hypothetical protein Tco_0146440 [Tanacetum coccineum]